jgi:hypothetical protein
MRMTTEEKGKERVISLSLSVTGGRKGTQKGTEMGG